MNTKIINIIFVAGFLSMAFYSMSNFAGTNVNQNGPYIALSITALATLILITITNKFPAILKINSRDGTEKSTEIILIQYLAIGWILILLMWYVGALNGILRGTDSNYVFRNFFGLLLYGLIPITFVQRLALRYVYIALLLSGILQAIYMLSFVPQMNVYSLALSLSGYRVVHNPAVIIMYPLLAVSAAFCLYPKHYFYKDRYIGMFKFLNSKLVLLLLLIAIIVPGASKGHLLTSVVIIFCVWIMASIDQFRRRKIVMLVSTLIIIAILAYLIPEQIMSQLLYTFSNKEASNSLRATQSAYLIKEFSLLGAGLGTPLQSGYVRDNTGYGFELTYLNIIHKLGFFSIALFGYYLATMGLVFYRIFHRKFLLGSFLSLGLMGYLIVGAGNPLLLSATAVALHTLAVYILLFPNR